jgi:hypothetical protein
MIILHSTHDKVSRDFVAAHGAGHRVVDWYAPHEYAGPSPSAFPSVVDIDAEGWPIIVRLPVDMADAEAQIAAEVARRSIWPTPAEGGA